MNSPIFGDVSSHTKKIVRFHLGDHLEVLIISHFFPCCLLLQLPQTNVRSERLEKFQDFYIEISTYLFS